MTTAPIPAEPAPFPAWITGSTTRDILDALTEEERPRFEEQWRAAVTEAARSLNLAPIVTMLTAWRRPDPVVVEELTEAEVRAIFDAEAQRILGISGASSSSGGGQVPTLGLRILR